MTNPGRTNTRPDSPERPLLYVAQVYAVADAITPRYRALVFMATFASLRWAELAALSSRDIDIDTRTVRVTRQISYPGGGGRSFRSPKSKASRRSSPFLTASRRICVARP